MPDYQIALDLSRLPKRYAVIQMEGDTAPEDHTVVGTFSHGPLEDTLPKHSVSHVLYHHVQDALYRVRDGKTPIEVGFFPDNITDMANVIISLDTTIAVESVTVAPTSASIAVGATRQLNPTVMPASATDKTVTYETSDATKATVSASGLVTGVAAGTANITVKTTDGNKTAVCAITVT